MKMTTEHYAKLSERVAQVLPQLPAHIEKLRGDPKVKNLKDRVLWDVFHSCRMYQLYSYQEWDYLDTHIETAMRKILKTELQALA